MKPDPIWSYVSGSIATKSSLGISPSVSSLRRPRVIWNPCLFSCLFLVGWMGTVWHIGWKHDYSVAEIPATWIGLKVAGIGVAYLFLVNFMGSWLRRRKQAG